MSSHDGFAKGSREDEDSSSRSGAEGADRRVAFADDGDDALPGSQYDGDEVQGKNVTSRKRRIEDEDEDEDEDEEDEGEDIDKDDEDGKDDEDDEDEDDDDDDDDDYAGDRGTEASKRRGTGESSKRKEKKKKRRVSEFIEYEAEVDDEEEEEDYGDDEDLGVVGDEAAEAEELQASVMNAGRTLHRQAMLPDDDRDEELERFIEQRYGQAASEQYERATALESAGEGSLEQQSRLPTARDTKLWLIRCKPGREKEIVVAILQKFLALPNEQRKISGAASPDFLKGYVYVEAERETYARDAVDGLSGAFPYSIRLVPVQEMTDIFRVLHDVSKVKAGMWMRPNRGKYKGDLAEVVDVDERNGEVQLRIVPRIDMRLLRARAEGDSATTSVRKPPARAFDPDELAKLGESVESHRDPYSDGMIYEYRGERYMNGYLVKAFDVKHVEVASQLPALDEVQRFRAAKIDAERQDGDEDGDDNEDGAGARSRSTGKGASGLGALQELSLTAQQHRLQQNSTSFVKGDTVRVLEGDLRNLMGTVVGVEGNMVRVRPLQDDLDDVLDFPITQVGKFFKTGDHCKVLRGHHTGQTGLVVRVVHDIVTLFTDTTREEISVFAHDLCETNEVATGQDAAGKYQSGDLVMLDARRAGVILRFQQESVLILLSNNEVTTIRHAEIRKKLDQRLTFALDAAQNKVCVGDVVSVVSERYPNVTATVRACWKSSVFCFSKDVHENGGMFSLSSRNIMLRGGAEQERGVGSGMSVPQSPGQALLTSGTLSRGGAVRGAPMRGRGGRGGGGGRFGGGGGGRGRDDFVGSTVRIKLGMFKGLIGIVRSADDVMARVELHTKNRVISLARDKLQLLDKTGRPVGLSEAAGGAGAGASAFSGMGPPATPAHAPGTPMRPTTPGRDAVWDPLTPVAPSEHGGASAFAGAAAFDPFDEPTPQSGPPLSASSGAAPGSAEDMLSPYAQDYDLRTPGTPSSAAEEKPAVRSSAREPWVLVGALGVCRDGAHADEECTITAVDESRETATVRVSTGAAVELPLSQLGRARMQKNDVVKVLDGSLAEGILMGIDGDDGIVRLVEDKDIKMFNMSQLVKWGGASSA